MSIRADNFQNRAREIPMALNLGIVIFKAFFFRFS